jgi:hypothetical protein
LDSKFTHRADCTNFQTVDYELTQSIVTGFIRNADAYNVRQLQSKISDATKKRTEERVDLQERIKVINQKIEITEEARVGFTKEQDDMKK